MSLHLGLISLYGLFPWQMMRYFFEELLIPFWGLWPHGIEYMFSLSG